MKKTIAILILTLVGTACGVEGSTVSSAATVRKASCYAICAHSSHGTVGWTGPLRTGANAAEDAKKDADAHNKANPGHDASGSC